MQPDFFEIVNILTKEVWNVILQLIYVYVSFHFQLGLMVSFVTDQTCFHASDGYGVYTGSI